MFANMAETGSLVSWDAAEELGRVPGSEWVCPTGSLDGIEDLELSGERVNITDDDLRQLAGGRAQHVELIRFPEGYHAAKIVDSETGAVLNDIDSVYRYGGTIRLDCNRGRQVAGTAVVKSCMDGTTIPLDAGREIYWVDNVGGGTKTTIRPTRVDEREPDYISRVRTRAHVTPHSRELYLKTEGKTAAIKDATAMLTLKQNASEVAGKLVLWVSAERSLLGQLEIALSPTGQAQELVVHLTRTDGFLRALGVRLDLDLGLRTGEGDWGNIRDYKQRGHLLDAAADVLGLGCAWRGLDLRETASGLYAAMGQRDLDPATVLVPQV